MPTCGLRYLVVAVADLVAVVGEGGSLVRIAASVFSGMVVAA